MVEGNIHEGSVTPSIFYFIFLALLCNLRGHSVSSDAWISNILLFSYFLMDYLKHWQKSLCINPSSLLLNNYTHHHVPRALLIFDDIHIRTQNSFSCFIFFFTRPPLQFYSHDHTKLLTTLLVRILPLAHVIQFHPPATWRSDKAGLVIKYSLQTSTPGNINLRRRFKD